MFFDGCLLADASFTFLARGRSLKGQRESVGCLLVQQLSLAFVGNLLISWPFNCFRFYISRLPVESKGSV